MHDVTSMGRWNPTDQMNRMDSMKRMDPMSEMGEKHQHPERTARRRRGGRGRGRSLGWVALAAVVASITTGCITDRSVDANDATFDQTPTGPACRAAATLAKRLEIGPTSHPDPKQVNAALEGLRAEVPGELRAYTDTLLSAKEEPAGDGRTKPQVAWMELHEWSLTMCEASLLPSAWTRPGGLNWIKPEQWKQPGTVMTTTTLPVDPVAPPSFAEVVAKVAKTRGGTDGWWATEGLTGMVSGAPDRISVAAKGVGSPTQALAACEDLVKALAGDRPVKAVIRGRDGHLLAFTEVPGTCRISLGA